MSQRVDPKQFMEIVRPSLTDSDANTFARLLRTHWTARELCSLLTCEESDVRKVAAVGVGLIGDIRSARCLARALRDRDREVNQMAEHGLWSIWFRSGSPKASAPLREGMKLLADERIREAADRLHHAAQADPCFAEAFNQCAIAHYLLGEWDKAVCDCRRAIELIDYHYGAMAGMGHAYAQLDELRKAAECYRRALSINPHMSAIRKAMHRIESRQNDASGEYEFNVIRS